MYLPLFNALSSVMMVCITYLLLCAHFPAVLLLVVHQALYSIFVVLQHHHIMHYHKQEQSE